VETALDNEVEVRVERFQVMGHLPADKLERFALKEIVTDAEPAFGHRNKVGWEEIQRAARWRLGEIGPLYPRPNG
jgi:hypothetical protein